MKNARPMNLLFYMQLYPHSSWAEPDYLTNHSRNQLKEDHSTSKSHTDIFNEVESHYLGQLTNYKKAIIRLQMLYDYEQLRNTSLLH